MSQAVKDNKLFFLDNDATAAILKGAELMYDIVTTTYGPKGRNVLIEKTYGMPMLTRDGVTVARETYLSQREVNVSMQMMLEASQATNRVAGDGTTATVAFIYHLITEGMKKIAAGADPMEVRQQIIDDSYKLLDSLDAISKPVKKGQLEQVATVSSGDENLGRLIAEAVEYVGPDGGLITERAPISGVDREYVEGYYLQQGFPAIEQGKKTLDNPYVVITAKSINSVVDALELVNRIGMIAHEDQNIENNQPLREPLRIAFFGEISGEAYNVIVANISQNIFDGVIVKTPPMGDMGVQYLEDLATYTGGGVISTGQNVNHIESSHIGRAGRVTCTVSDTIVFDGVHSEEDLSSRIQEIKDRLAVEEIDGITEKLQDRIAKLENKIARFRIGGATDTEREEKEFRIEDAIQATRAAASKGVVAGGGITLLKLSTTKDISDISANALQETFKKLISNAGLSAEVKLNEALAAKEGYGFNLRKGGELVNLVAEGILDPTLVVRETIVNAASNAGNALTVGCIITFEDKKD